MSCNIRGDGTFDLKIHAVVVWGGGNLYNLDEIERKMIFYKTMKKMFSNLFSTWEKCVSLNCGNFRRTTHVHKYLPEFLLSFQKVAQFVWRVPTLACGDNLTKMFRKIASKLSIIRRKSADLCGKFSKSTGLWRNPQVWQYCICGWSSKSKQTMANDFVHIW